MKRKIGIVFMAVGMAMILAALLLLLYNQNQSRLAGEAAQKQLDDLWESIRTTVTERENALYTGEIPPQQLYLDGVEGEPAVPVLPANGYDYMGILSMPTLGLELPVMDRWDYIRLQIAPCRHFGSAEENNLVIAAHNYSTHFGKIHSLRPGDLLYFTTAAGEQITYTVENIQTMAPTQVLEVRESPWDLVLYTCTLGGRNRVVVGCMRLPAQDP